MFVTIAAAASNTTTTTTLPIIVILTEAYKANVLSDKNRQI